VLRRVDKRRLPRYTVRIGPPLRRAAIRLGTQTMPNPQLSTKAKPLSLAFSGGGVKCAAQAGVLAVLAGAGLPVGAIAGSSGGGIVGVLYGLGYSPHDIVEYFAGIHLLEVWDLDPTGAPSLAPKRSGRASMPWWATRPCRPQASGDRGDH